MMRVSISVGLRAWACAGMILAAGTAGAASYTVVDSSLATVTYNAAGPAIPTLPAGPWATVVVPLPAITPFNATLGTLVSATTELAPSLVVDASATFNATSISAGDPEAYFAAWTEATYTALWDELGDVQIGGPCQAGATGSFSCGESDVTAIAGTFVGLEPGDWPASSTFSVVFTSLVINPLLAGVTFTSAEIAATVGFHAVTTYEYTPAAIVPLPAAASLMGGALLALGGLRRRAGRATTP